MNNVRRELLFGSTPYALAFRRGVTKYIVTPAYIGLVIGTVMVAYLFVLLRIMSGNWTGQHYAGGHFLAYGLGGIILIFAAAVTFSLRVSRKD